MKKIYLLFAMLLGFFTPVFAQEDDFDFSQKVIQMSGAVANFEANTWYFVYQARGGSDGILNTDAIPSTGGIMTDLGEGETVKKMNITNVTGTQLSAEEKKQYLVRFVPVDEKDGCYNIQFGTGRFLSAPNGTGNSKTMKATSFQADAGEFNVYSIEDEPQAHFAMNVYDMKERIDNNGVDTDIVTWDSGRKTDISGNSTWNFIGIEWSDLDEYEMALTALEDLYMSLTGIEFNTGTAPGQCSAEAVAAFQAVMQVVHDALEPGSTPTLDEVKDFTKSLQDAYDAVLASRVPLGTGYYRIRGAMKYTNEVVVGQDPESGEDIKESQQVDKYMYSIRENGKIYARWNTPEDLTTDCPSLWQITVTEEGTYDIVNCATDARFNNVAKSAAVEMSVDSENLMAFDIPGEVDGNPCYNIRVATQAAGDSFYLHQGGHSNGAGVNGNIVGWSSSYASGTVGASEWYFDLVPDEDAAAIIESYIPIKEHEELVAKYKELRDEATAAIDAAKDVQTVKLITNASQFSSPFSDSSEGKDFNALLDNSGDTFWHSDWHGTYDEANPHYLQVELNEPTHELVTFRYIRRTNNGSAFNNDYVTEWGIYGSNDPDAAFEDWTALATYDAPWAATQTGPIENGPLDTQEMKYIRFYANSTYSSKGNHFWHIGDIQLYYLQENPNSQYSKMGQVAIDLDNLLQAQASIEDADLAPTDYDALYAAYEAFKGEFVDPAELRAVIDSVKTLPGIVVVGEGIGYWPDNSTATALQTAIDDATAYDVAGVYTATASNGFIADLRAKAKALIEAAHSIQPGKWYRIQFPSKEMFEEHGWDLVAGNGNSKDGNVTTEDLWEKYMAITEYGLDELDREEHYAPEGTVMLGHNVYFDDDEDIEDEGMAQFRFVAVGDTAFAMQNRATGMFLKAAGTSGGVTLSVHPSLFNVRAIGYGLNVIPAKNLFGEAESYLHAQVSGNQLVTWNVSEPGTRSALLIEEVEDVAAGYNPTTFNIGLRPAEIGAYCFATEVTTDKKIYGVSKIEDMQLTLVAIDGTVNAGRPFILINGGEEFVEDDDPEPLAFHHNYKFEATPAQESSLLKGSYYSKKVGVGVIIPEGDKFIVSKSADTWTGANGAYIAGDEQFAVTATVTYTIDGGADGIAAALTNVAKTGELYSIDGRLISRKANLNTLGKLGRGVYILNGTKVTVK